MKYLLVCIVGNLQNDKGGDSGTSTSVSFYFKSIFGDDTLSPFAEAASK